MRTSPTLRRHAALLLASFSALAVTLACSLSVSPDPAPPQVVAQVGGAPQVILSAPLEGATYLQGVPVNVLARVENAGENIDRVEIAVDEAIVATIALPNPAGAPAFTLSQNWLAEGTGTRTLSVTVFRADGTTSAPVTRQIEVVESTDNVIVVGGGTSPTQNQPSQTAPETAPPTNNAPATSGNTNSGGAFGNLFNRFASIAPAGSGSTAPPPAAPTEEQAALPPTEQPAEPVAPPPTEAPAASPTPSVPTATILVGANLRSGPSTEFVRIGSFPPNTQTEALAVNSARTWYKVRYYNSEGWIASELVNVVGVERLPIDEGPPPPTPVPPTLTPVPPTAAPVTNRNLTFDGVQAFNPFPPECRQTMSITLRLRNDGAEALGTTSAAIVRDVHIDSGARTETIVPIPDIAAGQSIEVSGAFLTVDTNFDSRHRIEIVLDSNGQIAESNENDNFFSGNEYTLGRGGC